MYSPNPEESVLIHDRVVAASGGSLGIREPGLLMAIANKPQASFGGEDLYKTLFVKAAALFEAICNYHVFVDGNKRTSIVVLEYFLFKNGYELWATKQQKEDFVLWTATQNPALESVAAWLRSNAHLLK